MKVLIGTYTEDSESLGIYTVEYDLKTGKMWVVDTCAECVNPSFVVVNDENVYAVQETFEKGSIVSLRIDERGHLEKRNVLDMQGGLMCHMTIWPGEGCLSAANYGTGSLNICRIDKDGIVSSLSQQIQYDGKGINPFRQEGPHTHSSKPDPSGRWLVVAELGLDRIYIYSLDTGKRVVCPCEAMPYIDTPAGCGPRHFAFHPAGNKLYVSGELQSVVLVYNFDPQTGELSLEQTLSTLPRDYKGDNLAAEIQISEDARFVYVSNRGCNTITLYEVNKNGNLEWKEICDCGGKTPRGFRLIGTKSILIANQDSNNLLLYRVDEKTGSICDKLDEIYIPKPVWIEPVNILQ